MNIIKTEINVGLKKPLVILHMTDTHLTLTDANDSEARRQLAHQRNEDYFSYADENLSFVRSFVEENRFQLIHTGDMIDFITPANLEAVKRFADDTGMLFIAGNHELHTCPNNIFCESDFVEDLKNIDSSLKLAQTCFNNDINYFYKEMDEIVIVGINNSDYQITDNMFEKLKATVNIGKPILLFMHIPLYEESAFSKIKNAMLSIPDEIVDTFPNFQIMEQKASSVTKQAVEYIKQCTNIKCIFAGHLHFNHESYVSKGLCQYITGIDTLRVIEIK